ncbi:MAG: sugar phosphate nucleotidyltransferase [Myxococcales bacterium]|nr:sugar phosphate nucleotidyltransferase [Myxococcales bacterium]
MSGEGISASRDALVGVVLAAGQGTRMAAFGERMPKTLLPVLGKAVVEHQIEHMRSLGIEEVFVVIGHLGHHIVDHLGDGAALGVRIRYVEQDSPRGIAHAVGLLESLINSPFLLVLGDIYFVPGDLRAMIEPLRSGRQEMVLAAKMTSDPEEISRNFAIHCDDAGKVWRVIEKPRHSTSRLKGCGIYLFSPAFFDATRRTPRSTLRDEYELTDAIQVFIDDGRPVSVAEVVELDVNLSHPIDLWRCNMMELERLGLEVWIADSARVETGASVHRCVLGAGVSVSAGVSLERCVVLEGTQVRASASDAILRGEEIFPLDPEPH